MAMPAGSSSEIRRPMPEHSSLGYQYLVADEMASMNASTSMVSSSPTIDNSIIIDQREEDEEDEQEERYVEPDEEQDDCERAQFEAYHCITALRMQYELYRLDRFPPFPQEYLTDEIDEAMCSQPPWEEADECAEAACDDDTCSMSSGMGWFLPSPSGSEYRDDDDISQLSWESENENDGALVRQSSEYEGEKRTAEDAAIATELDDEGKIAPCQVQGPCYFMKLPPEIRCIIYRYCLPPKTKKSLICVWQTKPRNEIFPTPVSHEEPTDYYLPSFSSNLHDYPLIGPRAAPIQREKDFVGQTILAVNRLIHEEASRDFYRSHTFRFNSRQLESRSIHSGMIPRLCNIEIEDAVFRFCQRSTEMKLIGLSRSPNLKRVVVGPRTAEGLLNVIRHDNRALGRDAYGKKSREVKPYAAKMYSAEYFKTQRWPGLPKVVIVELDTSTLASAMEKANAVGPFPSNAGLLLMSNVEFGQHQLNLMDWFTFNST